GVRPQPAGARRGVRDRLCPDRRRLPQGLTGGARHDSAPRTLPAIPWQSQSLEASPEVLTAANPPVEPAADRHEPGLLGLCLPPGWWPPILPARARRARRLRLAGAA